MSRAHIARLQKLEDAKQDTSDIPIWCDDRRDLYSAITKAIAEGEIAKADRPRCVYWADPEACEPETHERRLEAMGLISPAGAQ